MLSTAEPTASRDTGSGHPLTGKRIYIPPMAAGSAPAFAVGFPRHRAGCRSRRRPPTIARAN